VNWVDPGSMNTAMHRAAEPGEDPSQWAKPGDVTEVFLYLASDESAEVSGRRFEAQGEWRKQAGLPSGSTAAQTGVHRSDFATEDRGQCLAVDSDIAHP